MQTITMKNPREKKDWYIQTVFVILNYKIVKVNRYINHSNGFYDSVFGSSNFEHNADVP